MQKSVLFFFFDRFSCFQRPSIRKGGFWNAGMPRVPQHMNSCTDFIHIQYLRICPKWVIRTAKAGAFQTSPKKIMIFTHSLNPRQINKPMHGYTILQHKREQMAITIVK
jgi:hypothetical protein